MAKVSQKSIAQRLGLSQRAVSAALRGEVGVSSATRERVQATARRLGYRSNRLARSLIDGGTKIIGALTPGLGGLFLSRLFDAANATLAERGYSLMISHWQPRHQRDEEEVNVLLQYCVDGLIAVPRASIPWEKTIYAELARRGENVVLVNQKFPGYGVCSVYSDDVHGSREATRFLLDHGHRHIATLELGGQFASCYMMRRQGHTEVLAEAGIPVRPEYRCDTTATPLADWLPTALAAHPEITALFCFNDGLALDAMAVLERTGRRVPDDVAVVGYGNDIPYVDHMKTPLTTVNQCSETMGRLAAEQLAHMLHGEPVTRDVVVPTQLVVRQSAPAHHR